MHDKENIFVSLLKSALNIQWLPVGEHLLPILLTINSNFSLVDNGGIS